MANGETSVYTKAEKVLGTAIGILRREIVLGGVVTNWGVQDFKSATDDIVKVPIRARATADTRPLRATGEDRKINVRDLVETKMSVVLNKVVEQATGITDEQTTLDVVNFGVQVLEPQMIAVAEAIEAQIATGIRTTTKYHANNSITWNINEEATGATAGAYRTAARARRILNEWNVPAAGRILLVGPAAEEAVLVDKRLDSTNPEGLGQGALREAVVGKLAGFTVVTSNLLNADEAYAIHKSAFIFASGAPAVPQGAYGGSTKSFGGFTFRWLMDYSADYGTDRSILTAYTGFTSVADGPVSSPAGGGAAVATNVRAVKITLVDEAPV